MKRQRFRQGAQPTDKREQPSCDARDCKRRAGWRRRDGVLYFSRWCDEHDADPPAPYVSCNR